MKRLLDWKLFSSEFISSFCSSPTVFNCIKTKGKKLPFSSINLLEHQLMNPDCKARKEKTETYLTTRTPRTVATMRMRIQMTATTTWAPPLPS